MLLNRLIESLGLRVLLLVILVPGVAALVYTSVNTFSVQRSAAEQDLGARARAMSQLVDDQLLRVQHALALMATTSPPDPHRPLAEYVEVLVRVRELTPFIDGIILFDAEGSPLLKVADVPDDLQLAPTVRRRIVSVVQSGVGGPGPVVFGSIDRRWLVTIDVPVYVNGKMAYVLNAIVSVDRLQEMLLAQGMPPRWLAVIFDNYGNIAARTAAHNVYVGSPVMRRVREWMRVGLEEVGLAHTLDGELIVAAMYRSSVTGYGVVAGVPKDLLDQPAQKALLANVLALTSSLLLGLFLAWRFARTLSSAIKRLENATKAVASGQTGIAVPAAGSVELVQLSRHFEDMVKSLQSYQRDLEHSVTHDTLTGLPNRVLLSDHLGTEVARAHRSGRLTAVLLLDLDRFALVNGSLAHAAGDEVLCEAARRLRSAAYPTNFVARLGGDEFVIVASELSGEADAASLAVKILHALAVPMTVQGHVLSVTGSIGITVAPRDGDRAGTLLMNADGAMYRAKANGGNQFQFFALEINKRVQARLNLEIELREALDAGHLVLHYQPRINLESGVIVGAEALVRWRHPKEGLISPAEFIPIAEESGLIVPLGLWVLERACLDAVAWRGQGGAQGLPVSVNVSARQFQSGDMAHMIEAVLRKTGLPPHALELELTESAMMLDFARTLELLRDIKAVGVRVALDDFGTGYSSLAYLKHLPVDVLKIDQSFVRDITDSPDGKVLVQTILTLGHSLRQEVVAEGVETEDQADFLRKNRCELAQGFLFGKPLPMADFVALLHREAVAG